MNLSGNDKNKITGKKYQPVMSVTGLKDQGLNRPAGSKNTSSMKLCNVVLHITRYFLSRLDQEMTNHSKL